MLVNNVTRNLKPYPMEELARIKKDLMSQNIPVYDFGTGDPNIPLDSKIRQTLIDNIPVVTNYPSVKGIDELQEAHENYLKRRFNIDPKSVGILPTFGSKEAIFHIALSLIGRRGKKRIAYPDPGYPVYSNSIKFAAGIPTPMALVEDNNFLMQPWKLPEEVQDDMAALWVNYPHNPSGTCSTDEYYEKMIKWGAKKDVILLCDDCYVDIYDTSIDETLKSGTDLRPKTLLQFETNKVLSFFSLSKRSGMTGVRAGFIAGDPELVRMHSRARANFGVAPPTFIQKAAAVAWNDDSHVEQRRAIFTERMNYAGKVLTDLGLLSSIPKATFYLWAKIPGHFALDDVKFCLELAKKGVIASPSSWVSESIRGYFRLAMVPELEDMKQGLAILESFVNEKG